MPTSTPTEKRPATPAGRDASASRPRAINFVGLLVVAALAGALFVNAFSAKPTLDSAPPIEQLRAWVKDNPTDPVAWQQLGDLYLADAGAANNTAAYLSAEAALLKAKALQPDRVETTRSLAVAAVGLHRFGDGKELALTTLETRPQDRVALAALVDAETELGSYDDAMQAAERLVSLRPDVVSYSRLSYVRQLTGDLDGALEAMFAAKSAALGSSPDEARINLFLAELHRQIGDFTSARLFYQDAADVAVMSGRANLGLAELSAREGDYAEATRLLAMPGVTDTGLSALQVRARIDAATGDLDGLEQQMRLIRDVVATSIGANIGIDPSAALLEADFGEPAVALELATKVLAAQPGNIYAHQALALAKYKNGDVAGAIEQIEQALRTGSQDPLVLAHAAQIYYAAGNYRAASLYQAALSIDPGVVRLYDGLTPEMFIAIDPAAEEASP